MFLVDLAFKRIGAKLPTAKLNLLRATERAAVMAQQRAELDQRSASADSSGASPLVVHDDRLQDNDLVCFVA